MDPTIARNTTFADPRNWPAVRGRRRTRVSRHRVLELLLEVERASQHSSLSDHGQERVPLREDDG